MYSFKSISKNVVWFI